MKTTTMGQAAGAGGFALAVVTILVWLMSLKGIAVPDGVAAAAVTIITIIAHYLVMFMPTAKITTTAAADNAGPVTAVIPVGHVADVAPNPAARPVQQG